MNNKFSLQLSWMDSVKYTETYLLLIMTNELGIAEEDAKFSLREALSDFDMDVSTAMIKLVERNPEGFKTTITRMVPTMVECYLTSDVFNNISLLRLSRNNNSSSIPFNTPIILSGVGGNIITEQAKIWTK